MDPDTVDLVNSVALLVPLIAVYLLPTMVAIWRGHPNGAPIAALNILLGWTFVGWVGALVWSLTAQPERGGPKPFSRW